MIWKPNVTVAAIVEKDQQFLMVQERIAGQIMWNQPAGHLDPNESLIDAVIRETREETRYLIEPTALIGVYHTNQQTPWGVVCYLRFAFAAKPLSVLVDQVLDQEIMDAVWLSYDETMLNRNAHRSLLVARCLDDYRQGKRFPLELLQVDHSLTNLLLPAIHDE